MLFSASTKSTPKKNVSLNEVFAEYQGNEDLPLAGYAAFLILYNTLFFSLLISTKKANKPLPKEIKLGDLLLLGVGTHKISRLLTRGVVLSPIRAPFAKRQRLSGAGEAIDKPRGGGLRSAIGDFITCPWCLGAWVSTLMCFGFVWNARLTRLVAGIFSVEAISDILHIGYNAAKKFR